jgi:MFS family permease
MRVPAWPLFCSNPKGSSKPRHAQLDLSIQEGSVTNMPLVILMAAVGIAYIERTSIAHVIPYIRKDFAYDTVALGYVLSAFGWGYVIALPLSGFIITRFGHRRVLGVGAVAWVVAAAGFACARNVSELAAARFALGIAEAPLFPLFVSWIVMTSGRNATSAKIGIVEGTSYVGMAFSGPLTVFAANNMGWRAAYASVGLLALIVAAAALFLRDKSQPALPITHSAIESDVTDKRPFRIPLISFAASAIGFLLYNSAKRSIRHGCRQFL